MSGVFCRSWWSREQGEEGRERKEAFSGVVWVYRVSRAPKTTLVRGPASQGNSTKAFLVPPSRPPLGAGGTSSQRRSASLEHTFAAVSCLYLRVTEFMVFKREKILSDLSLQGGRCRAAHTACPPSPHCLTLSPLLRKTHLPLPTWPHTQLITAKLRSCVPELPHWAHWDGWPPTVFRLVLPLSHGRVVKEEAGPGPLRLLSILCWGGVGQAPGQLPEAPR